MTEPTVIEPTDEDVRLLLSRFGISEQPINMLLKENEIPMLIAVTEWVLRLNPGFRNLLVIQKISEFMKDRDPAANANYLEQNPCIPSLPSGFEIAKFFAVARVILECETSLYKSPEPSPQALSL